jgi:hypothetical protein
LYVLGFSHTHDKVICRSFEHKHCDVWQLIL